MKSVLIVDDSLVVAEKLIELLSDIKVVLSVTHCSDYEEAVQYIELRKPDIVMLDIRIAGKSGIILLRHIKQKYPDSFVIMITNHNDQYYRSMCLNSGANAFLDKSGIGENLASLILSLDSKVPLI